MGRWGIDIRFANSLRSEKSRDALLELIPKLLTPAQSLVHLEIVLVSVHAGRDGAAAVGGGQLSVESEPSHRTRIRARVPFLAANAAVTNERRARNLLLTKA